MKVHQRVEVKSRNELRRWLKKITSLRIVFGLLHIKNRSLLGTWIDVRPDRVPGSL